MSFGLPWLAVSVAFALHVLDEATSGFLGWYNPRALQIRRALGGFPFPPTFTFWPWLLGLVAAVLASFALTPVAFRGAAWLRPVAVVVAVIQAGNGALHLTAAVVTRRPVPGLWSAPLLLGTAVWLLLRVAARG
jgi:hypothetical protein